MKRKKQNPVKGSVFFCQIINDLIFDIAYLKNLLYAKSKKQAFIPFLFVSCARFFFSPKGVHWIQTKRKEMPI